MNRPWLAVVSGLVISSTLAATAWSQTATRQPTLAERMAAMRRGWASGDKQPAAAEPSSSGPQSPAAQSAAAPTQGSSSMFNRGSSQQPSQRTPAANAPLHTASRPRAGSVQARPTDPSSPDDIALPGLGGSPLPSTASRPNSRSAGNAVARELASDYPLNQSEPSSDTDSQSDSAAPGNAQGNPPAVRRSPQRRAPMHVGPNDLQRELVGAFPTTPVDESDSQSTTSDNESPTDEPQADASAAPLALPAADDATSPSSPANEWPVEDGGNAGNSNSAPIGNFGTPPQLNVNGSASDTAPTTKSSTLRSIDLRPAFGRNLPVVTGRTNSLPITPIAPTDDRQREAFGDSTEPSDADPSLLVSQQTPIITTDIRGPRQIMVGREATYRVQLDNQGMVPAEGIVASIRIPSWADVIDTTTSHGTIQQSSNGGGTGLLEWQIVRLDPQSSETVDIRLIPRASRPLELGVNYTVAPVGSRAIVEVQEPKLGITVTGPEEVLYGKPQVFRLAITNPGTGVAENVKIDLLPPGGGDAAVSSHPLGDLPAGATKTVEVELTAREPGKLSIKAHASAEGGLACDANKEIFCRKPELQVDWRGPGEKYAGTQATYFFRVRNPGTAPAEDVTVRVALPSGAEYAGASEGQSLDADRREVSWRVGTLGPGDDYYMELKCLLQTPGSNQLKIAAATASGDLADNKLAETKVVALADLKLEVGDPSGPIAVGDEALYEIRVTNRGASAAKDINIVALFSDGVEPDQVEGALYSVADGRVSFRTIDELPAGRQIALRIRAHALQPGTHVFRAEVLCRDLDIKLAAEETTRFYSDDLPNEGATPQQQAAERSQQFDEPTVR